MREHIYAPGGWGIIQAGNVLMVMVAAVALDHIAHGRNSVFPAIFYAVPGTFFMLAWTVRACRRVSRMVRWIARRC